MRLLRRGYTQPLLPVLLLVVLYHVHGQELDAIKLRKRLVLRIFGPKDMGNRPLGFHRLKALHIPGLYTIKMRIRRGAPDWINQGLTNQYHLLEKKQSTTKMKVAKLENILGNNWRELDRMLICSKISFFRV